MAYTPNTWAVGDVITADKLNALEQAVAANSTKESVDFIIKKDVNDETNTPHVVVGDLDAVKTKITNNAYVHGAFYTYNNGENVAEFPILSIGLSAENGVVLEVWDTINGEQYGYLVWEPDFIFWD